MRLKIIACKYTAFLAYPHYDMHKKLILVHFF